MQSIDSWNEKIQAVAEGIVRWLNQDMSEYGDLSIAAAILRVSVNDAHILGVEGQLWIETDAEHWLGEEYLHSDIWQCAVAGAIATFKNRNV